MVHSVNQVPEDNMFPVDSLKSLKYLTPKRLPLGLDPCNFVER